MLRFLLLFSFLNPIVCLNAYESPRHDMFKWHANCRSRAAAVHVAQGCVSFRFEARLWHRKIPKNREKIAASSQWVEWRNGTKNSLVENIFFATRTLFPEVVIHFRNVGCTLCTPDRHEPELHRGTATRANNSTWEIVELDWGKRPWMMWSLYWSDNI